MLNNNLKHYFIGIALAPQSTVETGIAVLDKDLNIITLDKAFSMQDLDFFFENFSSLKNSVVMASIPENMTLLNSKWKVLARKFQVLDSHKLLKNRQDWVTKTTNRGSELFSAYKKEGIDIFRFDVIELKKAWGLATIHKDRSPGDCKYVQNVLKMKFMLENIPSNMFPASQLEAILGAILAHRVYYGELGVDYKITGSYYEIDIVNAVYSPP